MQRFHIVRTRIEHQDGLSGPVGLPDGLSLRTCQSIDLSPFATTLLEKGLPGREDNRCGARIDAWRKRHDCNCGDHGFGGLAGQITDMLDQCSTPGQYRRRQQH